MRSVRPQKLFICLTGELFIRQFVYLENKQFILLKS